MNLRGSRGRLDRTAGRGRILGVELREVRSGEWRDPSPATHDHAVRSDDADAEVLSAEVVYECITRSEGALQRDPDLQTAQELTCRAHPVSRALSIFPHGSGCGWGVQHPQGSTDCT